MRKGFSLETTSMFLHIAAMFFMLCDHLWATIVPGNNWLTCIGRIAFPIFAFLIVEGYFHTKNFKKYILRLLLFALLSELPFDLVAGGTLFYPFHQNVLWSFLISLGLIHLNERARRTGKWSLRILTAALTVLLGTIVGLITMVDYHHAGILTVLAFYFFRGRRWWNFLLQLFSLFLKLCNDRVIIDSRGSRAEVYGRHDRHCESRKQRQRKARYLSFVFSELPHIVPFR